MDGCGAVVEWYSLTGENQRHLEKSCCSAIFSWKVSHKIKQYWIQDSAVKKQHILTVWMNTLNVSSKDITLSSDCISSTGFEPVTGCWHRICRWWLGLRLSVYWYRNYKYWLGLKLGWYWHRNYNWVRNYKFWSINCKYQLVLKLRQGNFSSCT
jgi:hypothetical protein